MAWINTEAIHVKKLLANGRFVIPSYQRMFEWDELNFIGLIEEMKETSKLKDFIAISKNISEQDDFMNNTYEDSDTLRKSIVFLGNIVVHRVNGVNNIVDGQQRMTSILLMLEAAMKISEEKGLSSEIIDIFYKNIRQPAGSKLPIITSDVTKQKEIYKKFFSGDYDKRTKLYRMFAKAKDKLQDLREDELNSFINLLLHTQIIEVVIDKVEDAFDIFEKLNSKSTALQPADLIKNQLMKLTHNDNSIDAVAIWDTIYSNIAIKADYDSSLMTSFIRMIMIIEKKAYLPKMSLYTDVFSKLDSTTAKSTLLLLEKYSKYFYEFFITKISDQNLMPNFGTFDRFLNFSKVKVISTLSMYFISLYKRSKITGEILLETIQWLEKFFVSMFTIMNYPSKEVDKIVPKVIDKISKITEHTTENIKEILIDSLLPELTKGLDMEDVKQMILNKMAETFSTNDKAKYILRMVWNSPSTQRTTTLITKKIHLEHLLPQAPSKWIKESEWEKYADNYDDENKSIDPDTPLYKNIYSLGNMFLVDDQENMKANNFIFLNKLDKLNKDILFNENKILKDFDSLKTWTEDKISERTEEIITEFENSNYLNFD